MGSGPLINRVANSALVTINLEKWYPVGDIHAFDLKDFLFMELILKEKDFRIALKAHDWSQYEGGYLTVYCSADAIIPIWAYMLVATHAKTHCKDVVWGDPSQFLQRYFTKIIGALDGTVYQDQRVVIKGCSDRPVPASAYLDLTKQLLPFVKSIMYGEPCSTVPIYKRPKVIK